MTWGKRLFWIYVAALVLTAIMPMGSLSPKLNNTSITDIRLDYLLHGLTLFPMALFWRMLLPHLSRSWILLGCLLLAATLEGLHFFLPYRAFNIYDMAGNMIGVTAGWLALIIVQSCAKSLRLCKAQGKYDHPPADQPSELKNGPL